MELIDLSSCVIEESLELKKASLKAFLLQNNNYDIKKISIVLSVSVLTVREWIIEFKPSKFDDTMKIDEKVKIFKIENPSFSQRDIAKHFKISLGSINKYLKNLR